MWARLSIVAGLLVGVAAAGLLLGGLLAFAPEKPSPSVAAPSAPVASIAPSAVPSPSAPVASIAPSAVPSRSAPVASIAPSAVPSPSAIAQALASMMPGVDVTP